MICFCRSVLFLENFVLLINLVLICSLTQYRLACIQEKNVDI